MKLLGIESSCEHVTVAACDGDRLQKYVLEGSKTPADRLIPAALALLESFGLSLPQLDAIVLGVGPGAFTSLRLGCSVAQGFALSADLPILPVCSLDAIAAAQDREHVLVATDARMGETYHAAYERDGKDVRVVVPPACHPPEQVEVPAGEWWGVGSAFNAYPDRLLVGVSSVLGRDGSALPDAATLLTLARIRGLAGAIDAARVAPLYVRDKVALTTAERLARGGRA